MSETSTSPLSANIGDIQDKFISLWHEKHFFMKSKLEENGKFFESVLKWQLNNPTHLATLKKVSKVSPSTTSDENNVLDYKKIIFIGDLHGDVVNFIKILSDYKILKIVDASGQRIETCAKIYEQLVSLEQNFLQSIVWNLHGNDTLICLLGDIVDSRRPFHEKTIYPEMTFIDDISAQVPDKIIVRPEKEDLYYVMEYILHIIILYLRNLCLLYNSNILTVFGNHDFNAIFMKSVNYYTKYSSNVSKTFFTVALSSDFTSSSSQNTDVEHDESEQEDFNEELKRKNMQTRATYLSPFYVASPLFAATLHLRNFESVNISHSGVRSEKDLLLINRFQKEIIFFITKKAMKLLTKKYLFKISLVNCMDLKKTFLFYFKFQNFFITENLQKYLPRCRHKQKKRYSFFPPLICCDRSYGK